MSDQPSAAPAQGSVGEIERQIRARIDALSYLPTTAAVALKFVELGKDPEAEPADYAKVISADSSLSTKLLALSNSSWAGVRAKVTTVKMAVNLLGLGTVRTLAISYCMTGLHNELRLAPQESETFWEASLSKAVAAKKYASLFDTKLADEAFVAGLFQDIALPVMYSVVREPYLELLRDPRLGVAAQLQKERELFGVDHAEIGLALAQKLELPEIFVDTIAFHHNAERLAEFVEPPGLRDAARVSGLFPHALNAWTKADADACAAFLQQHTPATGMTAFVAVVQREFADLYKFFNEGQTPEVELTALLEAAAREAADNTTLLVGRVNDMLEAAASRTLAVNDQVRKLEDEATADALTGVLNRQGFAGSAPALLAQAARYGVGFALGYFDIDHFKQVNDEQGHAAGDAVLKAVAAALRAAAPEGALVARLGGDEFVLLLHNCARADAQELFEELLRGVAGRPVPVAGRTLRVSLSAGLLLARPTNQVQPLDMLLSAADKLVHSAKRAGGNQVQVRVV